MNKTNPGDRSVGATNADAEVGVRAIKGALWSGVNTLLLKVTNIAIMALVIRIVTPRDFGIFAVALVVHAVVSSFGELGLSSCIARRDLDPDRVASTVALLALLSSFTLACIMALAAEPLATSLGASEAAQAIRVLSIAVFLGGVFTVPGALLVREFRQDRVLLASVVSFLPMNALLIFLAVEGNGALAFAWSRVLGQLIGGAVMAVSVKRHYWPRLKRPEVMPVLRFGLPLAGANLLSYVLLNADYAIIAKSLGIDELGIYMLAFTVASWSTSVLSSTINSVAMPAFSAIGSDPDGLRQMLRRATQMVSLIAFPVGALTVALSHSLIEVIYGETWILAAPVLSILAVYGALFSLSLLLSNLLVGTGRSGTVMVVQSVWIAALIPSVAVGVSQLGLTGAAYAHVAVIILVIVPMYLWSLRGSVASAARVLAVSMATPVFASVLAGAMALWASSWFSQPLGSLVAGGLVGGTTYCLLVVPMVVQFLPHPLQGRVLRSIRFYGSLMGAFGKKVSVGRGQNDS
ncbi:oligosaccharide flippase family protein [Arthrobacter sp. YAF17]|uniref:oligosaccharide flippase family protein n=1 Tax=Arthrobacter sp. YAF17 TaxID=3233077 RepID=UPI003F917B43